MRLLCVPGADEKLASLQKKLMRQKAMLYSLKYTLVRRDGMPMGVSRKETCNGAELYLLIRYEGVT